MIRRFLTVAVLTAALLLSGCLPAPAAREVTYYNGYMGLAVKIPAGWSSDARNEQNLTSTPDDSMQFSALDLYDYEDGGFELGLISMQNGQDSTADDHAYLRLSAEYYPEYSQEEYLDLLYAYIEYYSDEEYTYTVIDESRQMINKQAFTRFLVEVEHYPDLYYEEYYVVPVKDMFFIAYINYWPDSKESKMDAYSALSDCFVLSNPGAPPGGRSANSAQAV